MRQLPAFPHLRFRPTSRLADLGAKSPSIELLQKVRLTGSSVPLQMIADQSTWCNSRWSGASYAHNAPPVFNEFGTFWTELTWSCSQICNWKFLKEQQRSTLQKMQPAESTGDKMYTKKITRLIPQKQT